MAGVLLALIIASGVFLAESQMRLSRRGPSPAQWPVEEVQITAKDGVVLRGWHREASAGNGKTVLLLHGIQDNRSGMTGVAEIFLRRGYAVLLIDLRGHGASGGLVTYGVREAEDIRGWAHWLRTRKNGCLYGYGASLGAAELLESLRLSPGFCAVVAEAPFSDFREAAYDRLGRTGISRPLWWLSLDAALFYTRIRFGLDLAAVSPRLAVANSRTPVLLIHGSEDTNLRVEHSRRIHAANPATTRLWEVPGADHFDVRQKAVPPWEEEVVRFLEAHGR